MRVLAIGDIHGCSRAFDTLISAVAPTKDDRIVALGDFVDWGPDSAGVLDRIIELRSAVYLVTLRGNHEEMMLRARDDPNERALWLRLGGQATLDSYGRSAIPERTCLDTTTSEFWQADQRGNVRRGTLFDLRNESGRAESP